MKLVTLPSTVISLCRISLPPLNRYIPNCVSISRIHCSTLTYSHVTNAYTCVTNGRIGSVILKSCQVKNYDRTEQKQSFHQCSPNLAKKIHKHAKPHEKENRKKGKPTDDDANVKRVKLVKLVDTVQLFSNEDMLIGKHTLAGAREYAKSKGFKLAKLEGKFTDEFPSYKLVTIDEQKEEQKKKPKEKSPKRFDIETKIASHDLQIKISQIVKILTKGRQVKTRIVAAKHDQDKGLLGSVHNMITEGLDSVGYIKESKSSVEKGYISTLYVPRENIVKTADGNQDDDDGDKKE